MLTSMTGFGAKTIEIPLKKGGSITVGIEIKSLNSRFFEATCKLPSNLGHTEVDIINLCKKKLVRGRVFLNVRLSGDTALLETLVPAYSAVEGYLEVAKTIKKKYKTSGELSISDLINLPNIFTFEKEALTTKEEALILDAVDAALDALHKVRVVEGKTLMQELEAIFKACQKNITKIETLSKKLIEEQKKMVAKAVASAEKGDEQARIKLEELYAGLNRMDIAEEISRFSSHLTSVSDLLKLKQLDKGRRFDFILQELLRETNTVASKCSNFAISSCAVDIKVDLEKVREQVQNIV